MCGASGRSDVKAFYRKSLTLFLVLGVVLRGEWREVRERWLTVLTGIGIGVVAVWLLGAEWRHIVAGLVLGVAESARLRKRAK